MRLIYKATSVSVRSILSSVCVLMFWAWACGPLATERLRPLLNDDACWLPCTISTEKINYTRVNQVFLWICVCKRNVLDILTDLGLQSVYLIKEWTARFQVASFLLHILIHIHNRNLWKKSMNDQAVKEAMSLIICYTKTISCNKLEQ